MDVRELLEIKDGDVVSVGPDNETKIFQAVRMQEAVVTLKLKVTDFDATEESGDARPDLTSNAVTATESTGPGLLTWGGAGLAAAGTAGALVFGMKTRSLHDDFMMMPTPALADDGDKARTFTNVSIGVGIVGASMVVYDLFID